MAVLEEAGLIRQPHTSAGRVPTDAGYRLFVDQLATVKPLSAAETRAIHTLLDGELELDQIVERAVKALAQLTHQVAVVQYPSLRVSTVRHIELLEFDAGKALLVLVTDSGRLEQRQVRLPAPVGSETSTVLRDALNRAAAGRRLTDAQNDLEELPHRLEPALRETAELLVKALKEAMSAETQERLLFAGASNLTRASTDFRRLTPVLEAIEEQVVLLKLLAEMSADSGEVAIRIGHETTEAGLEETSLVAAGYGPGRPVAHLGVLGPTRMDYPGSIAVVRAIALYLSRFLAR
jgi:heat-inducible transcriptional repressor